MHEMRNFLLVLILIGSIVWGGYAWLFLEADGTSLIFQRTFPILMLLSSAVWLFYALRIEDKLPDHLSPIVGPVFYEADGLSFMPILRQSGNSAELCVYYQNRFENPVQAVVHLRPPEDSFIIRPGMRDVHFAFKADGGDFGVIHQPIAVPRHLQGEVINVKLAAATYYPRAHGARLRKNAGMTCGTLDVDWGGAAMKTGVHEVSGEIALRNPVMLHLSMPIDVNEQVLASDTWRQEQLQAGGVG